jgi:hypothetical protein
MVICRDARALRVVVYRRCAVLRDDKVSRPEGKPCWLLLPEKVDAKVAHERDEVVGDVLKGFGTRLEGGEEVGFFHAAQGGGGCGGADVFEVVG